MICLVVESLIGSDVWRPGPATRDPRPARPRSTGKADFASLGVQRIASEVLCTGVINGMNLRIFLVLHDGDERLNKRFSTLIRMSN